LTAEVDILIGTPGRLIDYLKQRVYRLDAVEALVVDEADRLFDMGFIRDLRFLLRRLPPYDRRQSLLFSATLSWEVMELAYDFMNDPERVAIAPQQVTAENVMHLAYHVGNAEKLGMLLGVLRREAGSRILVFTNMKRTAERLLVHLEANGQRAQAITGDIEQKRRIKVLTDFREGRLPILVATDVASRGLHISDVSHVINYDLPQDPENYVHRIGRTARAGASGKAISLVCEDYVEALEPIERFIGFSIPFAIPGDDLYVPPVVIPQPRHKAQRQGSHSSRRDREERLRPRPRHPARGSGREAALPMQPVPQGDAAGHGRPRRRRRGASRLGGSAPQR
jgi:ATP-dependent RNA helicase RhlB